MWYFFATLLKFGDFPILPCEYFRQLWYSNLLMTYFLSSCCLIRKVYSKGLAEQLLKLWIFENGGLSIYMNLIVPQIIGATDEKENNLFNFLVYEVLELGMIMQLLLMAQMMYFGSQEWGFIIWCSWCASFVLMCVKKHLHGLLFLNSWREYTPQIA